MPDNLDGVFVEGTPIDEFLKKAKRDKKSKEIEVIRKQGEKRQRFTVVYSSEKKPKEETRKVAKRVIRFTDRRIREEYGIMKKPFESHAENVIWTIIEKGPVSTKDVGKEINFEGGASSLSAIISTIWKRLGSDHDGSAQILNRDSKAGKFLYSKRTGIDISVESAIEKYRLVGQAQYRDKMANKQPGGRMADKRVNHSIRAGIEEIASGVLGIEVKVSGRVDIVFKFER